VASRRLGPSLSGFSPVVPGEGPRRGGVISNGHEIRMFRSKRSNGPGRYDAEGRTLTVMTRLEDHSQAVGEGTDLPITSTRRRHHRRWPWVVGAFLILIAAVVAVMVADAKPGSAGDHATGRDPNWVGGSTDPQGDSRPVPGVYRYTGSGTDSLSLPATVSARRAHDARDGDPRRSQLLGLQDRLQHTSLGDVGLLPSARVACGKRGVGCGSCGRSARSTSPT
jgi:hypothetical protein